MVTILSANDRNKRLRLYSSGNYPEKDAEGFQVLEVLQEGLDYKQTRVKLLIGSQEVWLGYDEARIVKGKVPSTEQALLKLKRLQKNKTSFSRKPSKQMKALMKGKAQKNLPKSQSFEKRMQNAFAPKQ